MQDCTRLDTPPPSCAVTASRGAVFGCLPSCKASLPGVPLKSLPHRPKECSFVKHPKKIGL